MDVATAYRRCEAITRREAKNFFYGIQLLPPPKRRALSALYAFARRVDDIGDGGLPVECQQEELGQLRARLEAIEAPGEDPVLLALNHATERYPIPIRALFELIDGVEMDVRGTTYKSFDDLLVYCRRVAGAVGRLSLAVFGSRESERASSRADALGVALQLTNILRDIREDRERGRIYIPGEDLERFECETRLERSDAAAFRELMRFQAERAQRWFERGLELLPLLDRRERACVATMAGIYHRLLERIERRPEAVLQQRVSLSTWEKGWVALRSLGGARP